MGLRYKVDSKLPEPVFIDVDQVLEIITAAEYQAMTPAIEDNNPDASLFTFVPMTMRPDGISHFRKGFFDWYTPVKLDNGFITLIYTKNAPIKVGDYVRYDVRVDQMTVFDPSEVKCKLTLVENTDGSTTSR